IAGAIFAIRLDLPRDIFRRNIVRRQPPRRVAPAGKIGLAAEPDDMSGEVELCSCHGQNKESCSQERVIA
ncbi:hypothetical protein, partial [Mesorhizobium sp.]|uniref:hypothetical protein n=1 Tax=Mesorhizobium sp. TaxID=1871066 RepID=UPI00345C5A51